MRFEIGLQKEKQKEEGLGKVNCSGEAISEGPWCLEKDKSPKVSIESP